MKKGNQKMFRSFTAILLVICMMAGLCPASFAMTISADEDDVIINYVSLGDSMTNGYGLTGYDNNGYGKYGAEAYPNQFATWLVENGYATKVNHSQLALSAMRAEDLHFILEFPVDDAEAIAIAEASGKWEDIEDLWNEKFTVGDRYTWNEFTDDRRFDENCGGTNTAAKDYQSAVANADIISIGTGNANFGVFLMGRMTNAIGFGGSPEDDAWIDFDRAIAECEPEIQLKVKALKAELEKLIDEKISEMELNSETVALMEPLKTAIIYTVTSYVLNYAGVLERILELNPDVEIMLVGIMNTMAGMNMEIGGELVPMDELMNILVEPVNAYIAGLPTIMQGMQNSVYDEATFYFASASEVECLVSTYEDTLKDENSVIRKRFVTEIVGDNGDGMVWSMVGPMFNSIDALKSMNISLVKIDLADIKAYESGNGAALTPSEKISCAVYLAFEQAVVTGSKNAVLPMNSLLSLATGLNGVFDGVAAGLFGALDFNAITDEVTAGVLAQANTDITTYVTANQQAYVEFCTGLGLNPVDSATYGPLYFCYANGMLSIDEIYSMYPDFGKISETVTERITNYFVAKYAPSYTADILGEALTPALYNALVNDSTVMGLLHLFGRMLIGNGLGAHPSKKGHDDLSVAVIESYENGYMAKDETIKNAKIIAGILLDLLEEYGPAALEALYNYGVEEGYIDPQEVAYWTGRLEAWKEGWNSAETDEEKLQVCKDIAWELYQTAVKKGLIDDEAVQNTIDEVKAVVNEIISALEEIKEKLENIDVAEIKLQLLNNLKSMLEDMASEIDPEVIAEIESVIETVKNLSKEDVEAFVEAYLANQTTKLFELVYDATNGEYAITGNDYYVAIGGNTVSGIGVSRNEATYTELLQDTLGIDGIVLSEENLSGKNIVEYINANKDEIAKATLITYQLDASDLVMSVFANDVELNADLKAVVEATTEVIKAGLASFDGSVDTVAVTAEIEAEIPDEVKVKLNEAGFEVAAVVETVANAVETIWAEVEAAGDSAIVALNDIDTETVEMVCDLAAEVVYAGITYVTGNIAGIEAIQAINPDALLIVAGMYNPLQGLSVTVGETTVDIGEIFGYVIEATDLYNLVYAIGNGNVVFVDVSEAETDGVNENIALDELTTESMLSLAGKFATLSTAMHANAEGHEYIYERIMNALTITVPVLYGDADGNGVVNSIDAMVVLQYDVELIGEDEIDLIAGDVDGDGVVNSIDAMLILQYDVELITEFPVETIAA